MDFKINHILIENFRCFERLETDLWDNTVIEAANEGGKSTVASAILWVLTGKDIEGNSSFEIVPSGKVGVVSPCVTLECMVDEKPVQLKREYKAAFTRDKKFADYVTVTYINGLETGVRKFGEWISKNICNEQVFKILSNPKTFPEDCPKEPKELMWQAQRRLLMSIIGDQKSDLEIAKSDKKWDVIVEPLERYDSASQYLTFLKKQYSDAQKQLEEYEVRIQQQESNIVEEPHTEAEIESLVADVKRSAASLKAQNEAYKKSKRSSQIDAIKNTISELTAQRDSLMDKYNEEKEVFNRTKQAYQLQADKYRVACEDGMKTLKTYVDAIEKLKSTKVVEVCETCGQKLSRIAVENSKKKIEARIKAGEQKTADLSNSVAQYRAKYDELIQTIRNLMEPTYPVKADEIKQEIKNLTDQLAEIDVEEDHPDFASKMSELESRMEALKQEYFTIQQNKKIESTIREIEESHKEKAAEISRIQMLLDTTKSFISSKCSYYESAINALFDNVRFVLFEKNKSNDEVKEICALTFNGHKYQDLSASTKTIAAIEVVRAFQKFYNVSVPIILDNAESITGTVETGAQTILMRVVDERCPDCGGESGRRRSDGMWTCRKCGNKWSKNLKIMEG